MPHPTPPDTPAPTEAGYGRRQRLGLVAGPVAFAALLALPAPEGLGEAAWRTAAVAVLMAVWWMSEALPIPATSLLPLLLLPVLGVRPIKEAAAPYANPLIFLFLGGFMLAIAMQRWQLHRRIALTIIHALGTAPRRLVAGFMLACAFLSMWISNTATTMMMLPIGLSVVELVRRGEDRQEGERFATGLMLAIAYACSIGGLATLIGTPTNALLAAFVEERYGIEIRFVDWMLTAAPLAVVGLALTYLVLTRLVFPVRLPEIPGGRQLIARELAQMGPLSRAEKLVAAVFAGTASLWIARPLLAPWLPGLSDTGVAMLAAVVLFALPVDWKAGVFALDWESAKRVPWGVLLLFGGGLSLAGAIDKTGLAGWIGGSIQLAERWPAVVVTLIVVAMIILLTELTSNTATVAAFLPVLASVAAAIGREPLPLLVPATLAASCAFMLPVATPPNAIVYGSGCVTIPQMARAGIVLNLLFVGLVTALASLPLPALF